MFGSGRGGLRMRTVPHEARRLGVAQIEQFRCDEPVRLDPDRIVVLYAELGQVAAERVISAAMEDLAVHMLAIQVALKEGQPEVFDQAAREMEHLARQVGLSLLARIARDLRGCVARADKVGQAAVLARLVRIADRSLTAVWDMADIGG